MHVAKQSRRVSCLAQTGFAAFVTLLLANNYPIDKELEVNGFANVLVGMHTHLLPSSSIGMVLRSHSWSTLEFALPFFIRGYGSCFLTRPWLY